MGYRNAYLIIYGYLLFSELEEYEIEPTRKALKELGYDENGNPL